MIPIHMTCGDVSVFLTNGRPLYFQHINHSEFFPVIYDAEYGSVNFDERGCVVMFFVTRYEYYFELESPD